MVPASQSPNSKFLMALPRFSPEWFFPDGDLLLRCGSTTLYLVHSQLLVSASQVFRHAIQRQPAPSSQEIASIHKHMRHVVVSNSLQARLKSNVTALPRRMQRKAMSRMNKVGGNPKVLIVGDTEENMNLVLRFLYSKESIPITKDVLPRLLSLGARYGIPAFVEICVSLLSKKALVDPLFTIRVCREWVADKEVFAKATASAPVHSSATSSPSSSASSELLYSQLTDKIKESLTPIYKSAISIMLDRFPQYYCPRGSSSNRTISSFTAEFLKYDQYEAYLSSVPLEIQFKCFERWNRYKRDMERYLQWLFTAAVEPLKTPHPYLEMKDGNDLVDDITQNKEEEVVVVEDKVNEMKIDDGAGKEERERKMKQTLQLAKENLRNQIRNEMRLFWSSETAIGTGTAGWKGTNTSYASHNMNIPSPSRLRAFIAVIHVICENSCETFRREHLSGEKGRGESIAIGSATTTSAVTVQTEEDRNRERDTEALVLRFSTWVHDFQEDNFRRVSKMVLGRKKWWEWRVAAANAVELCPFLLGTGEDFDDDEAVEVEEERRREARRIKRDAAEQGQTQAGGGGEGAGGAAANDMCVQVKGANELSCSSYGRCGKDGSGVCGVETDQSEEGSHRHHHCCEDGDEGDDEDECMFDSDTEIDDEEFEEDEQALNYGVL